MGSDGSIGFEEVFHDTTVDGAFKVACLVVDKIGEAVRIDSSADLLDNGSFKEVASLECRQRLGVGFFGYRDLVGS